MTYLNSVAMDTAKGSLAGTVLVPASVGSIGKDGFADEGVVRHIVFEGDVPVIARRAFAGMTSLESVEVRGACPRICESAFEGCVSLRSFEAARGPDEVGPWAFYGCASLSQVTLGPELRRISPCAFEGCSSLECVELPVSLRQIGAGAFAGCSSLRGLKLPDGIERLDVCAFEGCSSLGQVAIPDSLKRAGSRCFGGCAGIEYVTERFSTPDGFPAPLSGLLCAQTRPRTLAQVLLFHPSISRGFSFEQSIGDSPVLGDIAREMLALIESRNVLDEDVWMRAGTFLAEKHYMIEPDVLGGLLAAFESKGSPFAGDLRRDERLRAYFGPQDVPRDQALAIACEHWQFSSLVAKFRPLVTRGVAYADGSGRCHPDAIVHVLAGVTWNPRRKHEEDFVCAPDAPLGSVRRILSLLDREDLLRAMDSFVMDAPDPMLLALPWCWLADERHLTYGEWHSCWSHDNVSEDCLAVLRLFHKMAREALEDKASGPLAFKHVPFDNAAECEQWVLDDLGLGADGSRRWHTKGRRVTVRIEEGGWLSAADDDGATLDDILSSGAYPAELDEVARWVLDRQRNLVRARGDCVSHAEQHFEYGDEYEASTWKVFFLGHPAYRSVARSLVWTQAGRLFTLGRSGPAGVDGVPFTLTSDSIRLAHPARMDQDALDAWRAYFADRSISQAFAQLDAPTLESGQVCSDRYRGVVLLMNEPKNDKLARWLGQEEDRDEDGHLLLSLHGVALAFDAGDPAGLPAGQYCLRDVHVACDHRQSARTIRMLDREAAHSLVLQDDPRAAEFLDGSDAAEMDTLLRLASERGKTQALAALIAGARKRFGDLQFLNALGL